jgi:hypothetical protein
MGATYPGTTPNNPSNPATPSDNCSSPPQSSCSPPAESTACDAHQAALIDLNVGTTNGLTVDLDAVGLNVADIAVDLGGVDHLLAGNGLLCGVDGLLGDLLT